jgi:hypothetical protein
VERFEKEVAASSLSTRGWVMQEAILSCRIIHFGLSQTYFQCGQGVWCEDFARKKRCVVFKCESDQGLTLDSPRTQVYFSMDPQFPERLLAARPYRIIDCIQYIYMYEDFTKRRLTKKSDRPVAFRGVEERIARAVSSDAHHGILKNYLHRMLL